MARPTSWLGTSRLAEAADRLLHLLGEQGHRVRVDRPALTGPA